MKNEFQVPVDQLTERVVKPKRILFMDLERVEHITSILQSEYKWPFTFLTSQERFHEK